MDLHEKIDKLVELIDNNYREQGFGVAQWESKDILDFARIESSAFNLELARKISDKTEALVSTKGNVQAIQAMAQPIYRISNLTDDSFGLQRYFNAVDIVANKSSNDFKKPRLRF